MSEKIIPIPARLKNVSRGGHVAGTEDIIDDSLQKTLAELNLETATTLGELDARIGALQEGTLIIVSELPTTGVAGKIYRVPGDGSYTDYMWDTSQQPAVFVELATYTGNEGDFFNVNVYNSVPTTPYDSAALARGAVPDGMKKQGLQITYLLADGWFTDLYTGSAIDSTSWATASNWKPIGPVSVSQNILTIGGEEKGVLMENVQSPEWIDVKTDSEDKILEGIKADGTKQIATDLEVLGKVDISGATYSLCQSPEWIKVLVDSQERIIAGVRTDGSVYIGELEIPASLQSVIDTLTAENVSLDERLKALESIISVTENPEFIQVTTDSEGKILQSRNPEGVNKEYVGIETPKVSIDGATVENIQDSEGRIEIKTDADGRILAFRDSEGKVVENVGVVADTGIFNHLMLTENGMSEFEKDLKDAGLVATKSDFSNASLVQIPKPKLAFINIICETLPTSKLVEYDGYFEYYDTYGNYFKKPITGLTVQGRSSTLFPKKNYGFDFDDGSKIKFGDWVEQDSFHLKANYIDCFRGGRYMVGYHMSSEIMKTYPYEKSKPWRYLSANNTTINGATGKIADDLSDEALGVPDGFPFKLYHNGVYKGLYNLQLKKHRDNYQMGKSKAKNIHIDGENYAAALFSGSANIIWSDFEVRNPKGLKDIDGKKYDGDNPKELSDTDALSAEVKGYIKDFSDRASAITTTSEFEAVIDVDYSIDYVLLMNFIMNFDVIGNNTQWCTWDAVKWFPMNYDDDQLFGLWWEGTNIRTSTNQKPDDCILGFNSQTGTPLSLLYTLYKSRMDARYKELVDIGILTVENVIKQLKEWCNNIGKANYDEEFKLWPETPSYRDGSQTYTEYPQSGGFYDSIERVEKYMNVRKQFLDTYFNYTNN